MKGQDLHLKWSMRPSIIVEKYRCQKLFQGIRSIFPPPEPFSLLNCESCPGENAYFRKMKLYFLIYLEENHLIYCSNWDCIRWGLWKLHSFYLQSYWRYFTLSDKTNLIFFLQLRPRGIVFFAAKTACPCKRDESKLGQSCDITPTSWHHPLPRSLHDWCWSYISGCDDTQQIAKWMWAFNTRERYPISNGEQGTKTRWIYTCSLNHVTAFNTITISWCTSRV